MSTKQEISRLRTLQESFSELVTEVVAKFKDIFNAITGIADRLGTSSEGEPQTIMDAVRFEAGRFQRDVDLLATKFREAGVDVPQGASFTELIDYISEYKFEKTGVDGFPGDYTVGDMLMTFKSRLTKIVVGVGYESTIIPLTGASKLVEAYLDGLKNTYQPDMNNCTELRVLSIRGVRILQPWGTFGNVKKLIDLIVGDNLYGDQKLTSSSQYYPTEAMASYNTFGTPINNLVPDEYKAEFPTNNSYWNYNLRRHFAANLKDRTQETTKWTITFSTNVYNAMEQATKDAFLAKGWNLAAA